MAGATGDGKPRRLGRGLSALLGEPVSVTAPAVKGTVAAPAVPAAAVVEPKATPRGGGVASVPAPAPAPVQAPAPGEPSPERVARIPVDAVEPSPFQPRRTFDEAQLAELAASIRSAGVVQPILVRPRPGAKGGAGGGARYELIAGERRWRASRLAGLTHVPAVVSELGDEQAAEWALIENLQRADLSPMERAHAIKGLCERFGLTHAQVAEKLGIDRSSATNLVRLTELEEPVRALLDSGALSAGHGKALLSAPAGEARVNLAKIAAAQGWSVRRLEQAATRRAEATAGDAPAPNVRISESALSKAAALRDLEKQLGEHLGTNVRIRASAGGKRGSVVIRFYDLDHFDGLMGKMGFVLK
jgi:ParB family chromosome partitioning protein